MIPQTPQPGTTPQPPEASQGAPGAVQAPPPPLPVDDGPFAPQIAEDGTQVAGKGAVLRPLLKKLFGGRAGPGPDDAGEAVEDAIASGLGAEQDIVGKARTAPTMTAGPMGPYPGQAEAVTGTTRPLPNTDYFESQETKQVLTLLERHALRKKAGPATPWAQTRELAESRQTLLDLTGKPVDLGWAPEELLALRNSLEGQAKELDAMARDLHLQNMRGDTPSPAHLAQFELASQRLVATNNAVAGLSTQAGQLLNSLRIQATDTGQQVRHLVGLVEAGGGTETVLEKIGAVVQANGDPSKINRIAAAGATAWEAALKWRYNMMLSSVRTHAANVIGSSISGVYEQAIINPQAWLFNRAERAGRKMFTGRGPVPDDIAGNPFTGELRGLVRGAKQGLSLAYDIARGAKVPAESMQGKFINESGIRYRPQDQGGNPVSLAANTPTRLLEAEDAFFRSVYYNARLEGLARARAAVEPDPEVGEALYQKLVEAPPEEMHNAAKEYSQKLTFTNDPNIYGKVLSSAAQAAAKLQEAGPFKLIMPFVKTPANLFSYSMQAGGVQQALAPYKTAKQIAGTPRERADAFARISTAVGIWMTLEELWEDKTITGIGSGNNQAVRLMESTGWRANSIKIDGTYYELNRLDPLGMTLAMAASYYELSNERNMSDADKMLAFSGSLLQMGDLLMDRSYLSSLGQFMDSMHKGEAGLHSLGSLLISTGTSFATPNILRDFREGTDEFRREQAWSVNQPDAGIGTRAIKNLYNALPGYSKELPVALDWKGDPILNNAYYLFRAMVPVRASEAEDPPPTTMALLDNGVFPGWVRPEIAIPHGAGVLSVPLLSSEFGDIGPSGHLYSYWKQLVGKTRKAEVERTINSAGYRRIVKRGNAGTPESIAGRELRNAISRANTIARLQFFKALNDGAEVTLYPGSGAEVKLQLPEIDTREWSRSVKDYLRMLPEEKEAFEPPTGVQYAPRKVQPRF